MTQKPTKTAYPTDALRLSQSIPKPSQEVSKKGTSTDFGMTNFGTSPSFGIPTTQQQPPTDNKATRYPNLYDFNARINPQPTADVFNQQTYFNANQFQGAQTQTQTYPQYQQFPTFSQPQQLPKFQPSQPSFQQFQQPYNQFQTPQQVQYQPTLQVQPTPMYNKGAQYQQQSFQNLNLIDTEGDDLLNDVFRVTTGASHTETSSKMSNSDPKIIFNQTKKLPPGINQASSFFSGVTSEEVGFPGVHQKENLRAQTNAPRGDEDSDGSEGSTSIFNSNTSKGSSHVAEIMESIAQSSHGASKYLHEVCDKIGKKGLSCEFGKDTQDGQPMFVATVTLENYSSTKSGRSKQDAKNAGSLEVLRKLIENDDIAESSLKMILYRDKKKMTRSQETKESIEKKGGKIDSSAPMKIMGSGTSSNAIDQLAEIAKENNLQLYYEETTEQGNFVMTAHFPGTSPVKGYGKTKVEAKKEAAQKLLINLNNNKELKAKYLKTIEQKKDKKTTNPTNNSPFSSVLSSTTQETSMFSARPNVLDGFLQAAYFADLQNEIGAFGLRPEAKDSFEVHLQGLNLLNSKQEDEALSQYTRIMIDMIKKCLDIEFIQKNSSKIHPNVVKVVESIKGFHFFPVGSYALGQMRKDNKIIDFDFIYELSQIDGFPEIPNETFLKCLWQILEADNINKEFEIKLNECDQVFDSTRSKYLSIKNLKDGITFRLFGIKTTVVNPKDPFAALTQKYHPSIVHVTQIDRILRAQEDRRSYFNKLCSILKTWRRKCEIMDVLPSEVLEILCLHHAINYETNSFSMSAHHILDSLRNKESTIKLLKRYSDHWQQVYEKSNPKCVEKISAACKSSLELIALDKFNQASF